jgi:hypothetical protein
VIVPPFENSVRHHLWLIQIHPLPTIFTEAGAVNLFELRARFGFPVAA